MVVSGFPLRLFYFHSQSPKLINHGILSWVITMGVTCFFCLLRLQVCPQFGILKHFCFNNQTTPGNLSLCQLSQKHIWKYTHRTPRKQTHTSDSGNKNKEKWWDYKTFGNEKLRQLSIWKAMERCGVRNCLLWALQSNGAVYQEVQWLVNWLYPK